MNLIRDRRALQVTLSAGVLTTLACGTLLLAAEEPKMEVPLIARDVIFGNPERTGPQISPDGKQIAYIAPVDGVMNLWVGNATDIKNAKPVTADKGRGITQYFWAYDNSHILYLQDQGGNENWSVFSVSLTDGKTTNLTPMPNVAAQISGVSAKIPNEILVGVNDRNPQLHDLWRINISTGERKLVAENPGFAGFVTDDDYNARLALAMTPDGGMSVQKSASDGAWANFAKISMEDSLTTGPTSLDATGQNIYMIDSRGRNTAALTLVNLETGASKLIAENPKADVDGVLIQPTTKALQAVSFNYLRTEWVVLDKSIEADFAALKQVTDGDFQIASRTYDDSKWIVSYVMDDGPVRFYLYDRPAKKTTFLFTNRPALEDLTLAKMHPVVIKSRDGLDLVSYLSLPPQTDSDNDATPNQPLPMVLLVHGGPWARDEWGYNGLHQWLANRGYAVLSVNFRGSTGFGKDFINASNMEWGAKMHNDLLDAVDWAVGRKIADPSKVAIMGGSYGGYATLVGVTMTPDKFACGVDIVGPSSIVTLLNTIPPYWQPMIEMFTTRVGDHRTDEGRKFLEERSPLTHVANIKKPLLIGQGANDPRVKVSESEQIVAAMKEKKLPVTYVVYPDEGHGFVRPENKLSFFAITEAFLGQHVGGRVEPIGEDFKGSSLDVQAGAGDVPGVESALTDK